MVRLTDSIGRRKSMNPFDFVVFAARAFVFGSVVVLLLYVAVLFVILFFLGR